MNINGLIFSILTFISFLHFNVNAQFLASPPNEFWIEWDSTEGLQRQASSQYKAPMMKLLRYYESQIRPPFCGVATAVIALNSVGIEPTDSKLFGKFRMFTQEEFFNAATENIVKKEVVSTQGISLKQMDEIMRNYPLKVSKNEARKMTDREIRKALISALQNEKQIIMALYSRKGLQQTGSGHWSPVAAYDEGSDSFLVLDVARFKYPPVWVDASAFIEAMRMVDGTSSRGFLILEPLNEINEEPCGVFCRFLKFFTF